jgi:hypothetical protein
MADKKQEPATDTRRDWETVQEDVGASKTERLRIGTGWLVRTTVYTSTGGIGTAMIFVDALVGE